MERELERGDGVGKAARSKGRFMSEYEKRRPSAPRPSIGLIIVKMGIPVDTSSCPKILPWLGPCLSAAASASRCRPSPQPRATPHLRLTKPNLCFQCTLIYYLAFSPTSPTRVYLANAASQAKHHGIRQRIVHVRRDSGAGAWIANPSRRVEGRRRGGGSS